MFGMEGSKDGVAPVGRQALRPEARQPNRHVTGKGQMTDAGRRFSYAFARAHDGPAKRPKTLRGARCKAKCDVEPHGPLPINFANHIASAPTSVEDDGSNRISWRWGQDLAQLKRSGYVTWEELRGLVPGEGNARAARAAATETARLAGG